MIFIVVYVGAIAVLFLFVVMMLDIKISRCKMRFFSTPVGGLIGGSSSWRSLVLEGDFVLFYLRRQRTTWIGHPRWTPSPM